MLTAIEHAPIHPPVWSVRFYAANSDDTKTNRRRSLALGESAHDDRAYSAEHHCFYRTLAEGALDIITVVDEFGSIVYTSPSAGHDLGYALEELVGRNLFEFVHPDDILRVRASFDECRRHDTASAPVEHRLRHTDGEWRTFESVGRFQADGAGGRVGIIHSRDVETRKLLEAQVRQAQKMEAV